MEAPILSIKKIPVSYNLKAWEFQVQTSIMQDAINTVIARAEQDKLLPDISYEIRNIRMVRIPSGVFVYFLDLVYVI